MNMYKTFVSFRKGSRCAVQLCGILQKRHLSDFYNENEFRKQLIAYSRSSTGSVELEKDEELGIAKIMINNPEKKNALTGKMMVDLSDIVSELENWTKGKGVILHGTQGEFCSGGDLNTVKEIMDPVNGGKMCLFMQNMTTRLHNLPLISVALVEGRALGGGAEMATACDFRLVKPSTKIGFVQTRLNVLTGWGGGTRLVRLIGRTNSLELLSTGKIIGSKEAYRIGLADTILQENDDSLAATKNWLLTHTHAEPEVVRAVKKMVASASIVKQETALHKEKEKFASVWGGPAHKASMEKNIKHE